MHRLAHEGRRHLLIIPIAFVTDHIETLHEINIEVRREAAALGVVQFEVMPGLNDDPRFISALTSLVQARLGHADVVRTCSLLWSGNADRPRPFQCPQISPL